MTYSPQKHGIYVVENNSVKKQPIKINKQNENKILSTSNIFLKERDEEKKIKNAVK